MATSFSSGGSQSTRREPPTMGKRLVNFITCGCESSAITYGIDGNHLTTYGTSGNQSHNLWNKWESISQPIEWVVINLTTYGTGGNESHNL